MEIALVALAGVFVFVGALSLRGDSFVVRRRIRNARRWTIAELPEGTLGRIVGRVRSIGEPLHSPLTGRACVGFVAEIYSEFSPGGMYRETRSVPFVIEDDSGRAIVDSHSESARLDLQLAVTGACGRELATPAEHAMFARRARGPALKLEDWTFREGIIEPGAIVSVLGAGDREPDPEAPIEGGAIYREMPTRLRLFARRGYPLAISDRAG
jgi:hypothetical protein